MDKNVDEKGRWRCVTVSFRVSKEESEDLNTRVRLSGLTKQDYIIRCLQKREIVVQPNTRVFKALRNQMNEILTELKRLKVGESVDDEFLLKIKNIGEIYSGLKE